MADVFLSYSHRDTELVQRVKESLRAADFKVWDDTELMPGTPSWENQIATAIDEAKCVVVILSPNAVSSKWVLRELSYAETLGLPIFPLLAAGEPRQSMPFGFSAIQYVDIRRDFESGMKALIPAIEYQVHQREIEASRTPASEKLISKIKALREQVSSLDRRYGFDHPVQVYLTLAYVRRARVLGEQILSIDPHNTEARLLLARLIRIEERVNFQSSDLQSVWRTFVREIVVTTIQRPVAFLSFGVFALSMWEIRDTATPSVTTFLLLALGVTAIVLIAFFEARLRNRQDEQVQEALLAELQKKIPSLFEQLHNDLPDWLYQDQRP